MSTDCAIGNDARACIEPGASPHTFDASSELYELQSESLVLNQEYIDVSGLTGTRQKRSRSLLDGIYNVSGDLVMLVSPAEMALWAQRILGGTEQTDTPSAGQSTWGYGSSIPPFGALIDRIAQDGAAEPTWQYNDLYINQARFSSGPNEPVIMTLSVIGKSETKPGATFPTLTYGTTVAYEPMVHHQTSFVYNDTTYRFNRWELTINNGLAIRQENSQAPVAICPEDFAVNLRINAPWVNAFAGDYGLARNNDTDNVFSITGTGVFVKFTFPGYLHQRKKGPTVGGPQQIRWDMDLEARYDSIGAADAINIVLDYTP